MALSKHILGWNVILGREKTSFLVTVTMNRWMTGGVKMNENNLRQLRLDEGGQFSPSDINSFFPCTPTQQPRSTILHAHAQPHSPPMPPPPTHLALVDGANPSMPLILATSCRPSSVSRGRKHGNTIPWALMVFNGENKKIWNMQILY